MTRLFRSIAAPALLSCTAAQAQSTANCAAGSNNPSCGLASFLHVLYIVAAALALVLVVVIGLAIHAYRKNKRSEMMK